MGTLTAQIPSFLLTEYDAKFKLIVFMCAKGTNNCMAFRTCRITEVGMLQWKDKEWFIITNFILIIRASSSVSIELGYRLDDRGSRVRFPAGVGNFSLHHRVKNSSGAHPTSYPMGTRGPFPGGKAAGA
jgi:hypothetical protein